MTNDEEWNKYVYPELSDGRIVLRNKYGITNAEELYKLEAETSFAKLVELIKNPIDGDFDKVHLCLIHKYLFEDLYDWAGTFRTVNIEKGHSAFADYKHIEKLVDIELAKANEKVKHVMSNFALASVLADLYIKLVDIHPFREGNGRAIREFIREFCLAKTKNLGFGGQNLNWAKIDKKELIENIDYASNFRSAIELQFYKALESVDENKLYQTAADMKK